MPLEHALLAVSITFVVLVFAAEVVRARHWRSVRLPLSMLYVLRITLGIAFAILGVVGSLLPIMQGWFFFLLAALVLFPQSSFAVKVLDKVERKMPRLVARLRRWGIGTHRDHDTIRCR